VAPEQGRVLSFFFAMQALQYIPAEIAADSSSLLGCFGEYDIYPMQVCSEDQIAELFVKVCQRGNPLLQERPHDDLILLGRAFYRKCMPLGFSQVALHKGVPVALNTVWDAAEGGVWEGSGLAMPQSMEAHAEVGKACFACLDPNDTSRLIFAAFGGVDVPHSGKLFGLMGMMGFRIAKASGFKKSFQFSVLQKSVLARTNKHKSLVQSKVHKVFEPVLFEEVAAEREAIRAELKELGGVAKLSVAYLSFMLTDFYIQAVAASCRANPEELKESSLPMADRQMEILKERATTPISRL